MQLQGFLPEHHCLNSLTHLFPTSSSKKRHKCTETTNESAKGRQPKPRSHSLSFFGHKSDSVFLFGLNGLRNIRSFILVSFFITLRRRRSEFVVVSAQSSLGHIWEQSKSAIFLCGCCCQPTRTNISMEGERESQSRDEPVIADPV